MAFGHWYPPLISNDKLRLIFSFTFCAFFPFISNTSIVSRNFGANLDAQNAGNAISVLQISKIFLGEYTPRQTPIHAWYVGHTRCLQPLLSPSNILFHRKVPFQKMPPHGKILKKGPGRYRVSLLSYSMVFTEKYRTEVSFAQTEPVGRGLYKKAESNISL